MLYFFAVYRVNACDVLADTSEWTKISLSSFDQLYPNICLTNEVENLWTLN